LEKHQILSRFPIQHFFVFKQKNPNPIWTPRIPPYIDVPSPSSLPTFDFRNGTSNKQPVGMAKQTAMALANQLWQLIEHCLANIDVSLSLDDSRWWWVFDFCFVKFYYKFDVFFPSCFILLNVILDSLL